MPPPGLRLQPCRRGFRFWLGSRSTTFREGGCPDAQPRRIQLRATHPAQATGVVCLWDHQGGSDLRQWGRPSRESSLRSRQIAWDCARNVPCAECGPIHQPGAHAHEDAVVGGAQRMGVSRRCRPVKGCPPRPLRTFVGVHKTVTALGPFERDPRTGDSSVMAKKNQRALLGFFDRQPAITSIPASVNSPDPRPRHHGVGVLGRHNHSANTT